MKEITPESIIESYRMALLLYDKARQDQDYFLAKADDYGQEASQWHRRATAWRQIYVNLFDEKMPFEDCETPLPIKGNEEEE